ncbi:MAG: BON domain-containing protein [Pseudomonadota bacterium]|nr:BON domain-containing protein [Pseudomonadota bacterium]
MQSALHSDPYVFDTYITVRVQEGRIVLSGFVYDAWDLRSALRIARSAAGLLPVVDDVEIKTAGLR